MFELEVVICDDCVIEFEYCFMLEFVCFRVLFVVE